MNAMSPCQVEQTDSAAPWEAKEKHFENVYKQCYRVIYGICRRYSSKPDDAQDLTHDVFVRYYQNFEKFRHESSPSTWMYKVAINLGIQKWRRERVRYVDDKELESVPDDVPDSEMTLLDRLTLEKILGRYPERMRKIFILHHLDKMTQTEIGELLGISRSTVIRHLNHFKLSCQRHLNFEPG